MADGGTPTRIRLLEAAVAVMAEGGWAAVTSRAVADRAQANNALVHYYFGSVDALRRAAVLHAVEQELEGPVEAILRAEDTLAGVAEAVRALVDRGAGTAGQRVMVEAMLHGVRDEELRAETERQIRMFRDLLAARLAEDRKAGALRPDADPRGLAVAIAALLDGLLMHVLIDPGTEAGDAAAGLLALLRPPGTGPGPAPGPEPGRADQDGGDEDDATRQ
ncbi:transcriptional regulator, TetR family [Actinomadura meyerae]|jgi:AcrR family transcriptional regulator|uniref:Transcriptional regulator, TetR family n=1 Tax=Actinomadura meyerae TaxID=240840 RepID=A0A239H2L4_9ACTN|nr:TetR family transcriptional regulator [Actinomadura meyerae]SNS75278.1 transcriptional regulator, TetR family [Actinomadura meyerae]